MKERRKQLREKNKQKPTRKQTKKETPNTKRQAFKYGEQKSQTAKSEMKLDLRRGCEEICFKEKSTQTKSTQTKKGKGQQR